MLRTKSHLNLEAISGMKLRSSYEVHNEVSQGCPCGFPRVLKKIRGHPRIQLIPCPATSIVMNNRIKSNTSIEFVVQYKLELFFDSEERAEWRSGCGGKATISVLNFVGHAVFGL